MRRILLPLLFLFSFTLQLFSQDSLNVSMIDRQYVNIGYPYSVAVHEDYAYTVSLIGGFAVFDVSNPQAPALSGYCNIKGSAFDVVVSGDYAYAITEDEGLFIIDISDPENPEVALVFDLVGRYTYGYGLDIVGDYLYAAVFYSGLWIIDISNPLEPDITGYISGDFYAFEVEVQGDYAYVADYNGSLTIINISDHENPTISSILGSSDSVMDVAVNDTIIYITDNEGGLLVADISDPSNPEIIEFVDPDDSYEWIEYYNGYIYIYGWGDDGSSIHIFNVSDPSALVLTNQVDLGSNINNFTIENGMLYLPLYFQGFGIASLDNPEEPELTGQYSEENHTFSVIAIDEYLYADIGINFTVFDISDKQNPIEVATIDSIGGDFIHDNGYLYAARYSSGIEVVDINDPENPEVVCEYSNDSLYARYIDVEDGIVYAAAGYDDNYFAVLDLNDFENPTELVRYQLNANVDNITCNGERLYVSSNDRIIAFDVSDPSDPQRLGHHGGLGVFFFRIAVKDSIVYVADPVDGNGLYVINFANPASPVLIDQYSEIDWPEAITISGNFLYLAEAEEGIKIFDISNPSDLQLVGTYPSYGYSRSITVSNETVYVGDHTSLMILDATNAQNSVSNSSIVLPRQFTLLEPYPNPFNSITRVTFGLPFSTELSIVAFNSLGQQVAQLAAGRYSAGYHNIIFDASELSSGTYFIHASVPGKVDEVKKVVLVR
ncbi:MAG: T9SS type A sorting domain-containing protein [Candidatus Electryonea clarkiae]|nr:T9SS type A sorting domain-containing protein [Candidatus Electryonea clarkiae]MDP8286655.1 T9SS type A sorting domain-containing protein [Candidatus Electryonea clarkiae]